MPEMLDVLPGLGLTIDGRRPELNAHVWYGMRCTSLRCALLLLLPLLLPPLLAAHPPAGPIAAAAAGLVEAHHTHSPGPAESVHEILTRVPADRCQQEPWTGQEAENKCATDCILTGCGPLRPRVLRRPCHG